MLLNPHYTDNGHDPGALIMLAGFPFLGKGRTGRA
jgi:hypothetical protein